MLSLKQSRQSQFKALQTVCLHGRYPESMLSSPEGIPELALRASSGTASNRTRLAWHCAQTNLSVFLKAGSLTGLLYSVP